LANGQRRIPLKHAVQVCGNSIRAFGEFDETAGGGPFTVFAGDLAAGRRASRATSKASLASRSLLSKVTSGMAASIGPL
jgi:hypothetical protein